MHCETVKFIRDHVQNLGLHAPVSPTHKIATFLYIFALMGNDPNAIPEQGNRWLRRKEKEVYIA
jgi:hypothetical protein